MSAAFTTVGPEVVRVGSIRALALSRGGTRLWLLTALVTTRAVGLRHGVMPSELSLWTIDEAPTFALRREASTHVPACAVPALCTTEGNDVVLMSSLGAMRFTYAKEAGITQLEALSVDALRAHAAQPAWLRHASFELIDGIAGTCFNLSANGAFSIERSKTSSRIIVRRVADEAPLAESHEAFPMASAACVDDRGEVALILTSGNVHRWDIRAGTTRTLEGHFHRGLLAMNHAEDVFALYGECLALHRLSTGETLGQPRAEPLGRFVVSRDLSRGAQLNPEGLSTLTREGDTWSQDVRIAPVSLVLVVGDAALIVRNEKAQARVDRVNAHGEFIQTLHLPARVREALALPATSEGFTSFVASKKGTPTRAAALFALETGELAHLALGEKAVFTLWKTGRSHTHTLAVSAAHDLVVVGHGLKGGMRGKSYAGNATFATADGTSLWSLDGTCLANGEFAPALVSSHAIDAQGHVVSLVGTNIYKYDTNTNSIIPSGAFTPASFPLTWNPDAPAPVLLPHGEAVLTHVDGVLLRYDLRTRRTTGIAEAANTTVRAISGDGRRLLLAHATSDREELALYALNEESRCLERWASRATGPAALSYDGMRAMLSGGDTLAEWVRF